MFPHRSSKPGKRGFGQRRTVVQLKDEPRRQPTYGFGYKPADEVVKPEATSNALSGLMSQYAMDSYSDDNSDDDNGEKLEEESISHTSDHRKERKQWPQFVAATDTQLPTFPASEPAATGEKAAKTHELTATESTGAVSAASSEGKDDIDTKLKDFLAEIESLEVTEKPAATEATADEKSLETVPDCDVENGIGTSEDDLNAPVAPQPPATVWQYCLDEGTQCYYYWNTETNEVTWEIPPGYSQYLLRHKEYERLLAKYEKEMAEWKKIHGTKKSKKTMKKDRKRRKKVEDGDEVIEPLVSYPPIEEEEEEEAANDNGAPVVYGPEKPPDEVLESQAQNDLVEPEPDPVKQIVEVQEHEERGDEKHGSVSVTPEAVALTTEGDSVLQTSAKKHHHKSSKSHEEEVLPLRHSDKTVSREHREQKTKPLDSSSKVKLQNDQLGDGHDRKADTNLEATSKIQDATIIASPGKPNTEEIEEIDDEEEFVNRELEDPVFTHYEYVNKKFTDDQNDDAEFAIEEIDRELELALEKQQTEIDVYSGDRKRKLEFMEDPSVSYAKRQKTETDVSHLVGGTFASLKEDIKFKVNELTEVLDLSSTIMEKLEFLEVPPCDWSNLQVLLIQMETRLMDWKFGGLNTDYMLQKLHEATGVLRQYEQTSCPPGWSCCWDRDFKRYFYNNIATGETSWRYPEVGGDEQKSCRDPGTSNAFKEDTETITKSSFLAAFNPNLQISCDNGILAAPASEPSGRAEEPDLSINIPSDLLTWAANPPPPPPETPPPSSPCSETEMPQHSPAQTSDNEMADDDCVICLDDEPILIDKEDHHDHVESAISDPESAFVETAHHTLPGRNIAGASVGSSPLPVIPAAASPEDSFDNGVSAASAVTTQALTYDDQYDGTPMEEQITHPIKEKKKKKEKLSLGSSLSMKKKNVSSLVEKWQKIQDDVSKEIEQERSKQMKLAELSGKASSSKTE